MIVSIAEDFTIKTSLDNELTALPDSGLYLNSGTHPSITIENLLGFLPSKNIVCSPYQSTKTYGLYESTRNVTDLVSYDGKIYQSIATGNTGNQPNISTSYWLETNKESLALKSLIYKTIDKVKADLGFTKRLLNSQKIYEYGKNSVNLPNDYSALVFEFKGSEYVTATINRILLTKNSTTPVNVYVVNQGNLIDTLQVTPASGDISWTELAYDFTGPGKWYFVIDSTDVLVGEGFIDPLRYDGLMVYTATGIGATPEGADYSLGTAGMGLGVDISVFKDGTKYLNDNLDDLGNFFRATFEYVVFQMYLHNSNNKSTLAQQIQMERELLIAELKSLEGDTVASRYYKELEDAKRTVKKTEDTGLGTDNDELIIEHGTI